MSVATIMAAVSQLAEPFAWRACGEKIDVLVLTTAVIDSSKSRGGDQIACCSALAGEVVVMGRNRGVPRVVRSDHRESKGPQSKTDPPSPAQSPTACRPVDTLAPITFTVPSTGLCYSTRHEGFLTVIAGQHGRPSHLEAAVYQVEVPLRLTIGSSFNAPAGRITCFPTGQNFVVSSRHCWLNVARMTMTTTERDDENGCKAGLPLRSFDVAECRELPRGEAEST